MGVDTAAGTGADTAWIALDPEPVRPAAVVMRNTLMRRRGPVALPGGALSARVAARETVADAPRDVTLLRNDAPSGLVASSAGLLRFAGQVGLLGAPEDTVRDPDAMPRETAILLAEAALAPWLEALEAHTGDAFTLAPVGTRPVPAALGLDLLVHRRGEAAPLAALPLTVDIATRQDALLAWLGPLLDALPRPPADPAWPVRVAFEIAATRLGLGVLRGAEPGDVIVLDERPAASRDMRVRLGAWPAPGAVGEGARATPLTAPPVAWAISAWAIFNNRSVTLTTAFEARPFEAETGDGMSDDADNALNGAQHDTDDAALDEVAVTLVFEAGRRTLTLGELRGLGPGQTLTLERRVADGLDVMAAGRRVGRGRLVRVGDVLGVRLTQLFGEAEAERPAPLTPD